jgi:hypothetical protein
VAAWRLRWQIAHDRQLAQEWEKVQQLWSELRSLPPPALVSSLPRPAWPAQMLPPIPSTGSLPSFAGFEWLWRRRLTTFSVCALLLIMLSAAFAWRVWHSHEVGGSFRDGHGRWWYIHGRFTGKASILSPKTHQEVGELVLDTGDPADHTLSLSYAQHELGSFHGYGRHEIHDDRGTLLAYLDLSPLTPEESKQLHQDEQETQADMEAMYQDPERITPNDKKRGFANPFHLPGLTSGAFVQQGVSWKVIGYAQVKATYMANGHPISQEVQCDLPPIVEQYPPAWRDGLRRISALAPARDQRPVLLWELAGKHQDQDGTVDGYSGDYAIRAGHWTAVRRSGKITGFGKHTITDEHGRAVLIVEITPLSFAHR